MITLHEMPAVGLAVGYVGRWIGTKSDQVPPTVFRISNARSFELSHSDEVPDYCHPIFRRRAQGEEQFLNASM